MSVGLDTNVLLRYLQGDDAAQSALAVRLVNEVCSPGQPALVSSVALAETCWVLKSSFRLPKAAVPEIMRGLLDNPHLRIIDATAAEAALDASQDGSGDFADYLIGLLNREAGARTTFTFDRAAAGCADFTLLTAESVDDNP